MAQATPVTVPDAEEPSAADRIDAAIIRIEAAVSARAAEARALSDRHAALKARMAEALTALDDVIARTPGTRSEADAN
ncbi:hypothetical protein SAMN05192583_2284 [Sphingomonas gellani]|uniref:Uncharacterized protein n=1 Tax=Sphingomonas gellani TaxID=1166340 RepID=A0A1H8ES26_9SPHN|nr:hypothetical protein [Sphingomonas gellani]SEN22285.1 hypothetical protein SAMN05192583_2284 [Sphingomonas gellani]